MKVKNKTAVALIMLSLLIMVSAVSLQASATGAISPASNSALIGMEASYTATGLDAEETYSVKLGSTTVLTGLTPTSAGSLTFAVSSATGGIFTVGVYNSTPTLIVSASFTCTDLMAVLMPPLVIFIGMTILFGLVKELKF